MQRTGQDFQGTYIFREFPAGVRKQYDQGSYHLRAVGANGLEKERLFLSSN